MLNPNLKRIICLALSAAVMQEQGMGYERAFADADVQKAVVSAAENMVNPTISSQGSAAAPAILHGDQAELIYDDSLQSNVLRLHGDAFGDGWLQLPAMFETDCTDGFTFSMRFLPDADAEDYTRLFQFSSIPFGTGIAPVYRAPDLSMDLNDGTVYRAGVFAGRTSVADDAHCSMFSVNAVPERNVWHQLTAVYSPEGAKFYMDGTLLSQEHSDTLAAACKKLFSKDMLSGYIYNAIGHSVYTDHDIRGRFDDIAFYDYALTAQQVKALPKDAVYLYTFEPDTVTEGSSVSAAEQTVSLNGTPLTSIPELQSASPDGTLTTKLWKDAKGGYYYSVQKNGDMVIEPSKLGLVTAGEDLSSGFSLMTSAASSVSFDETYTMPHGKHSRIRNHYNELTVPLVKGNSILTVIIRMYDDGMGFRYALNHAAEVTAEISEVVLPANGTLWGSAPNVTYEWEIGEFSVEQMTQSRGDYSVPLMGHVSDRYWVLLSEANVFNEETPYCAGFLKTAAGSRALQWRSGNKTDSVRMHQSFCTPWRAAVITDNLNDLSGSELILNLNPPSVLEDTSWIKPGKVAWSWWSSGGDSPIEYHMQKDYIDFAAANGWEYVCLDFGWALWENSAEKVRELCAYGAEKGVGIYLWYGVNNVGHYNYTDGSGNHAYPYYSLLDEATITREFKRISGLGVKGVKVDYYESDTEETMRQMYLCMDIAAENRLMVLFHGCTMPHGESRTYPNVVSYEAVYGAEYYKWRDTPSLTNRITYPFTRNVVGSADFTPTGTAVPGVAATAGFALSDVVNIESGVQHFAQSVYSYEGSPALPFLNDVPVAWDDMKLLDGHPMQFNVIARRSGADWYIGAATIAPRTVRISLSDLITDDGVYRAFIFGDNANGSQVEVTVLEHLTKDSVITEDLLRNGGCAIKITKGTMGLKTPFSNYQFYEAEHASVSGIAAVTAGKYCSGGAYVGYVGGGADNAVTFRNVYVEKEGTYPLRIYYISGETRSLKIDINGRYATTRNGLYANQNDWSGIAAVTVDVSLKAGENTIRLYNDQSFAPSIDRIAIANAPDAVVLGDVNADGVFSRLDVIALQEWLICAPYASLAHWAAGDLSGDGRLDSTDLSLMKRALISG